VRRDPALQAAPFPERRTGQRAFLLIRWGNGWERALGGGLVKRALLAPGFCAPFCEKGAHEKVRQERAFRFYANSFVQVLNYFLLST
ncbi:MAG: hypothetical protein AAGM67_08780, partial [Bacteroidota bacterium]